MRKKGTIAIVGSGLAGITAAEVARAEGFDGRVVVIGEDRALPYERPPLSKAYLRGESPVEDVTLHPRSFYDEHEIELLAGNSVSDIDIHASRMTLEDGNQVPFDVALLATGAAPRALNVPGANLSGVHLLRTLSDADLLAEQASSAGTVVVVGAGWIGCEVAASLRQLGKDVTIVAPDPVPLLRVLGMQIGDAFARLHADHGVHLRLGHSVTEILGGRGVESVVLDDGSTIACDLVVVGVGVTPRDRLAERAGIDCDNGILVDERLRTSRSDVFAAGDVANAAHPRYGRLRVEHWANARDQGKAAARSMLGIPDTVERIPYFFSDQYELGMEYTGYAAPSDEMVVRGDMASREFIAFWLNEGRVSAGMNVNVWDVADDIASLIRSDRVVDPETLKDMDVPLSHLLDGQRVS